MRVRWAAILLLLSLVSVQSTVGQDDKARQEESQDYFKKWLDQDVKYIITDEERSVFKNLSTPEEKESFIEQFWFRRDPDPRTSENEFKQEHYRRIAYANEKFQSGKPGWMTDRGRVYVIHGEPYYIERHPSGGSYQRPIQEGGTRTFTYPFEVWFYQNIDGIGMDVPLEFVDRSFSGEYRLALRPEEKDMLLYVPGTAPTIFELSMGHREDTGRANRGYFNPGLENNTAWQTKHGYSSRDTAFARYQRYAIAMKAPEVKFPDLRELVDYNITYNDLPFEVRADFVRLNDAQVLAPITVQFYNKDLTFERSRGIHTARVNIYGVLRNMIGRIIAEFEDTVVAQYPEARIAQGRLIKSIYQKMPILEAGRRYRLDVVVKDESSKSTGFHQIGVIVPKYNKRDDLMVSSLVLSKVIEKAPIDSGPQDMFVLGDLKILPNVGNTFYDEENVGVYLQIYNVAWDQALGTPNLRIRYLITKGDKIISEAIDNNGASVQYSSPQRIVLVRHIPLKGVEPGDYRIRIELDDLIGDKSVAQKGAFKVIPFPVPVQAETSDER